MTPHGAPASFAFVVPGHPVGWRAPSPGRRGQRHHSPPEMRAYKERVRLIALAARPSGWPTKAKSYRVDMTIAQRGAKPDRGNVQKLVEDAMTGVIYIDDCRIDAGCVLRERGPNVIERVEVRVEVIR